MSLAVYGALLLLAVVATVNSTVLVCYFPNWTQYRKGQGKYAVADIDPKLCTHFIYSFAKITNGQLDTFEWNDPQMYGQFHALKQKNPKIKNLIAVGGWNMASKPFVGVSNTAAARKKFCATAKTFLQKNKFDGLDFDWEYPAQRGGTPADKQNFALLVKECRRVFGSQLLITAATVAGGPKLEVSYDVPSLAKDLDFINVMMYDMRGGWDGATGHHANLFEFPQEPMPRRAITVAAYAKQWQDAGAPKSKLVIGLPTYGRSFTLSSSKNGINAPAAVGSAGPFTGAKGTLAYYEVCQMVRQGATVTRYKDQGDVVVAIKGNQWVGYDDVQTIKTKVEWIKKEGFAGAMIWSLDTDDFGGHFCGQGKYPLLKAIGSTLGMNVGSVQQGKPLNGCPEIDGNNPKIDKCNKSPPGGNGGGSTGGGSTGGGSTGGGSTGGGSTGGGSTGGGSTGNGGDMATMCNGQATGTLLKHPSDCTKFVQCVHEKAFALPCQAGLRFNPTSKTCDHAANVAC